MAPVALSAAVAVAPLDDEARRLLWEVDGASCASPCARVRQHVCLAAGGAPHPVTRTRPKLTGARARQQQPGSRARRGTQGCRRRRDRERCEGAWRRGGVPTHTKKRKPARQTCLKTRTHLDARLGVATRAMLLLPAARPALARPLLQAQPRRLAMFAEKREPYVPHARRDGIQASNTTSRTNAVSSIGSVQQCFALRGGSCAFVGLSRVSSSAAAGIARHHSRVDLQRIARASRLNARVAIL